MEKYPADEKAKFDAAFECRRNGEYVKGLSILNEIEERYENDSIISGLIATFYFEISDYEESAKYFKRTTILNPESELASLGFFHSQMELDRVVEALQELKRFILNNDIKEYKITIEELRENKENFDKEEQEIICQILDIVNSKII